MRRARWCHRGPSALAESLLRFGRELAESGPARRLGVAGNGFRSGLGRRVHALLTSPVRWGELSAVWRWSPRILALVFVLALTLLPVLSGPSGSLFGLLVQAAKAETPLHQPSADQPIPAQPPWLQPAKLFAFFTNGVFADSNTPPTQVPGAESLAGLEAALVNNGTTAPKSVLLDVKEASVLEGSQGQIHMDKWIHQAPPDQLSGPDAVAQLLRELKISHTNYVRVDYFISKNEAVTLTPGQFKAALESIEQQEGTGVLGLPRVTGNSGRLAYIATEDAMDVVTGVELNSSPPTVGVNYVTDHLRTGTAARILPIASADGWTLSVLSRLTEFRGYDKPAKGQDLKFQESNGVPMKALIPLPHLCVSEIQGEGTVREGETLALRGPAFTYKNTITNAVLGIFHRTHTETVRNRFYIFVTATSETK